MGPLLRTAAAALPAFQHGGDGETDVVSGNGLFKIEVERVTQIGAAIHLAAATPAGPKDVAENITKDIAKDIAGMRTGAAAETGGGIYTRVPEVIVRSAFLRITQDFVGFLGFFEPGFGIGVIGTAIWMKFHGQTTVCLFDLGIRRFSINVENIVVITFGHLRFALVTGDG